jgi:hypothetical protein
MIRVIKGVKNMGLMSYEEITKKFKVGDKVRLINGEGIEAKVGATAIVVGYEESCDDTLYYINIKWDRNELSGTQSDGGYYGDDVEVIEAVVAVDNCPRCGGKMEPKVSMMMMGEEFKILKCEKCGYCM